MRPSIKASAATTASAVLLSTILVSGCVNQEIGTKSLAVWKPIFNHKNLDGWTVKMAKRPIGEDKLNTFRVRDGKLVVSYDQYTQFDNDFGHIFYHQKLSHYNLRITYRFIGEQLQGGPDWAYRNSGVMLHAQPPESMTKQQHFPVSIEAQILGGNGQDDRTTANVCSPGTHFSVAGNQIQAHCYESNSKTYHGDQWVTMEIQVRGAQSIKHLVNGNVVFEYHSSVYDLNDSDTQRLTIDGIALSSGYIALQAESHGVEFKRIELQEL